MTDGRALLLVAIVVCTLVTFVLRRTGRAERHITWAEASDGLRALTAVALAVVAALDNGTVQWLRLGLIDWWLVATMALITLMGAGLVLFVALPAPPVKQRR
jgi:hypothetical protein